MAVAKWTKCPVQANELTPKKKTQARFHWWPKKIAHVSYKVYQDNCKEEINNVITHISICKQFFLSYLSVYRERNIDNNNRVQR
ncbi:unnamed protein product, partial [Vitis vinifera]